MHRSRRFPGGVFLSLLAALLLIPVSVPLADFVAADPGPRPRSTVGEPLPG